MTVSHRNAADAAIARPGRSRAEKRTQRLAWGVIGGAFAVWCALVALIVVSGRAYIGSAATPQNSGLDIQRGVVFYQDSLSQVQARAANGMGLSEGTLVEAAELTEADVRLFDGSALHLFPGTQVRLDAVRVGRFSDEASRVELSQQRGAARYSVAGSLPNGEGITLTTPHGRVELQRGEYLVWVRDTGTDVTAYSGKGHVEQGTATDRFRYEQRIEMPAGAPLASPQPLGENLIKNGDFSSDLTGWEPVDVQERGRKDVAGVRTLESFIIENLPVRGMRVFRDTAKDTHNETGISQQINRDVLPYRNLYINAWVRVDNASLSGGGYVGSEYPMMLQVDYVDTTGGRPSWSHGFYYANPENRPVINAEQIQQGAWLHYHGNLVELKDKPAFISSVRVIGSGHDFNAEVARVELIAE
jgi:hypothetical protein